MAHTQTQTRSKALQLTRGTARSYQALALTHTKAAVHHAAAGRSAAAVAEAARGRAAWALVRQHRIYAELAERNGAPAPERAAS